MNKQILIAMDWKNRSKEELKKNYEAASYASYASYAAYVANAAAYVANAAVDVDDTDAVDAAAANSAVEYWLKKYFAETGENREDYEKALEEMRK